MAVNFRVNHAGMAELLKSDDIRGILRPYAESALANAQADPHDDTFAYQGALRLEDDTTDRAVIRLVAGDWKGNILEARYGILQRAIGGAGGGDGKVSYKTLDGRSIRVTPAQAAAYKASRGQ